MFWADRIAKEIEERFGAGHIVIRDEKTISGRVHVGSMRGVAIHGAVSEALGQNGTKNTYFFELNDFDVFDGVPEYLSQEKFAEHVGKLLIDVPSPQEGYSNYAEFYGAEFRKVIEESGFTPQFYWGREAYESGKMDDAIRLALEKRHEIRRIYKEVSGSQKGEDWYPLSVVCPQCKKITDNNIRNFDGTEVNYECRCGSKGTISPFKGNAKLPWKVEWPAKWMAHGVMVEGGGKDHSTKGGARDVANHIAKEVFNYEPPFDIPYEFLLVGGRKMSSSKGRGSSAKEIADLMPQKIFRLALLGKDINQQFNFDPEGDTIPVLYDQYDKLAENYRAGVKDDYARLFEVIHPDKKINVSGVLPRFSQVAFVVQMPHMDIKKEFPDADPHELEERAHYAKKWLSEYAPEKFVFKLQDSKPDVSLTPEQKQALAQLMEFVKGAPSMPSGEELQAKLHELKQFKAVYLVFLGKDHGPKAGWFLSALPKEFVEKRLQEALQ